MESFIEIKHLEKVYQNSAKAVNDFNLDIKKNEFIVIVGPSGCGKSTTLRMIAGLEDITSGDLIIDGENVNYKPSKDRKMAIVFQSYALYPQMNVYENIAFPLTVNKYSFPKVNLTLLENAEVINFFSDPERAYSVLQSANNTKLTKLHPIDFLIKSEDICELSAKKILSYKIAKKDIAAAKVLMAKIKTTLEKKSELEQEKLKKNGTPVNEKFEYIDENQNVIYEDRKMTKREIEKKVYETADILDLGSYLDRLPKALSGGQMQRVALGRAIVKNVPIFLMDEPLSNLDAKLRLTMRSEIVKLHKSLNATTIYVTHDQTEAMTMADRIVVMSKGFVQQIDKPSDIYNNPKNLFVAKFVGSPTINILNGQIDGKKIVLGEGVDIKIDTALSKAITDFYNEKSQQFSNELDNFELSDEPRTFVLKVLSANAIKDEVVIKEKKKRVVIKKKETQSLQNDREYNLLKEMTGRLNEASTQPKEIILGIRPENLSIKLIDEAPKNKIIFKADVVELLGNEYHIHFTFLGNHLIAKLDAKTIIKDNQDFTIEFSENDFMYFDPITGERIY